MHHWIHIDIKERKERPILEGNQFGTSSEKWLGLKFTKEGS